MDRAKVEFIQDLTEKFTQMTGRITSHLDASTEQDSAKPKTVLSISMETRRKYAKMDAVEVVVDVFQTCESVFIDSAVKRVFTRFLTTINQNALARLVSICLDLAAFIPCLSDRSAFFLFGKLEKNGQRGNYFIGLVLCITQTFCNP